MDAGIAARLTALTDTVTEGTTSSYAAAAAIQKWLRTDGGFNYSLQLPESVLDENGQQIRDPILRFLKSKTGYCVQFASTMVMMARAKGIPARMALGFLPGTQERRASTPCARRTRTRGPSCTSRAPAGCGSSPRRPCAPGSAPTYTIPATAPLPGATTAPRPTPAPRVR